MPSEMRTGSIELSPRTSFQTTASLRPGARGALRASAAGGEAGVRFAPPAGAASAALASSPYLA